MRFIRLRRGARLFGACAVVAAFVAGSAANLVDVSPASATVPTGTMQLTPDGGLVGSTFKAAVSGFTSGETVDVSIGSNASSCTADGTGACTATLTVPAVPEEPYQYTVDAVGEISGTQADATYYVVPLPDFTFVSPASGPPGTQVTIGVADWPTGVQISYGYGEGEDGNGVEVGSCASDPEPIGSCQVTVTVPTGFSGGPQEFFADTPGDTDNSELVFADFDQTGAIAATPDSGPSGSTLDLAASGFGADDAVSFSFDGTPVGSCAADGNGDCTLSGATVPVLANGTYQITAVGSLSDVTGSTSFTVTSGLGVSPSSGAVGSTTEATASGFEEGETVDLDFNGAPAGQCTAGPSGECAAPVTVPNLPSGSYPVSAYGETSEAAYSGSFEVIPAVVVTPDTGAPGSTFSAAVSGFAADDDVDVQLNDADIASCTTDGNGACTVTVPVPLGPPASYPVTASDQGGLSASTTFNLSPGLVVSPASGPAGTQVTATAEGYVYGETVDIKFDATVVASCVANAVGGCSAAFSVPSLSADTYEVAALGTYSDTLYQTTFTETVPAVQVNPSTGIRGGAFDASATGFAPGETVDFTFDGNTADCTADANGACTTPIGIILGAPFGPGTVSATGESSGATAQTGFTVVSGPQLALTVDAGPQRSTFGVTVSYFKPFEQVELYFDGTDTGLFCGTEIGGVCTISDVTVPSDPTGPYTVEALGSMGEAADATFTVTGPPAAPVVSAVSPDTGRSTGGTLVTITGSGFVAPATVRFGSLRATHVSVVNGDTITAVSPPGWGVTNVRITVTSPRGTSAIGPGDVFDYLARPVVDSVSPNAGPLAAGTPVTIKGKNFVEGSTVSFGTAAATGVTVVDATTITATAPSGRGTVNVRVTNPVGTSAATGGDRFTYLAVPTVAAVMPSSAPAGSHVTVVGTNFMKGAAVSFAGDAATGVFVVDATHLVAQVPAGSGTVDVTVATPGGTSATGPADHFTYTASELSVNMVDDGGGSSITNTVGTTDVGATITYTVRVANPGSSPQMAMLVDPLPSNVSAVAWEASLSGGATASATTGLGDPELSLTMPGDSSIVFTIQGTVGDATGSMSNTVTVTPTSGSPLSVTDTDDVGTLAVLALGMTVSNNNPVTGSDVTYTITIDNEGPSAATDVSISDSLPADFSFSADTNTVGALSVDSGSLSWTDSTLAVGESDSLTITGEVSGSGTVTNSATVTATDSSGDTASAPLVVQPNLSVSIADDDGGSSVNDNIGATFQGAPIAYTVTVENTGSVPQTATLVDPLLANVTGAEWEASFSGGAAASATSGTGPLDLVLSLPAESSITITIDGTVGDGLGPMSNTVTVTPPAAPAVSATDTDDVTLV